MIEMIWKFSLYGFLKNLRFFEPFLYLFFLSRGVSFFHIGILIGIRELSQIVAEVPTGVLADLIGRPRTMVFCFASYLVSFVVFFFGRNFWLFVPAFILFGLGEALRTGTHKAIILDYLDKHGMSHEKTKYYGLTRSWSLVGSALCALLAAVLVFVSNSYEYVFIASTVPYILALMLMLSYPKYLDRKIEKGFYQNFLKEVWQHIHGIVHSFKNTYELLKSVGNSAFFDATFKISKDYIQPILLTYVILAGGLFTGIIAMSEEQEIAILMGFSFFIIFIVASFSSRNAHKVEKTMTRPSKSLNLIYAVFILLLLEVALLRRAELFLLIIIVFLFMYVLVNIRRPMIIGRIGDRMEKNQRASVLSIETQLKSIFAMILAPIFGLLADGLGVQWVFFGGAALMLVLMPFLMLKERK
ncbi:MAG: MFS transporter [Candidatus Thermoplasmatota archaeon]|nr:MFS transporter [Candidatus Thermoplasmatota archaeon]